VTDKFIAPWKEWWRSRPRRERQGHIVPTNITQREREKFVLQIERKYYTTHKSARVARWTAALGLVIAVAGFLVSASYSRVTADLGNALMILGVLVTVVSVSFFAMMRR